jgi:hypothetical protein
LPIIEALIRKEAVMRAFALLLALAASPAAAAEPAVTPDSIQVPPELTDPAMAQNLAKMLGSLTKAVMDMPVGEMQAAVEGRDPTAADKARTVRDVAGRDGNYERQVEQQVARAVPRMQAGMKAMANSLPGMMKALEQAADQMEGSLDRATANLPTPGYPKR